jgi:hypothetical protein
MTLALLAPFLANATIVTTFEPTRDTFMRGGPTDVHGTDINGRASKALIDFYLTDFDRVAIIGTIEAQLGHPFTFDDMADVEISWNLFSNDFQGYQPTALSRPAVFQGTQDWVEGMNGTGGATKDYALYVINDPANTVPWRNRAGDAVANFLALDKVENGVFEEWGGSPYSYREWALDDYVAFTYLMDPLSLGLFLNGSDLGNFDNELARYNNTEVYSRETTNLSRKPFLEVTVVPEPSACALSGFGALFALLRRRARKE